MTELLAGASAPDGSRLHGRAHAAIRSWGAGIVNHGGYDDLARCLESLAVQSRRPACVVVYDTGVSPERLECLRRDWPGVRFESGPNVGYAGGANRVVERLRDEAAPVDFVLLLNPDVFLEPDFAASLIDAMEACPEVVIATGKLLRADGVTIDSAGIVLPRHRRPRDRGSEQPDRGQYEARERVDAASGAAMMLRAGAIDGLTIEGELFDETFFAYHEDTDLCWRARRLGHVILYEPRAVARRGTTFGGTSPGVRSITLCPTRPLKKSFGPWHAPAAPALRRRILDESPGFASGPTPRSGPTGTHHELEALLQRAARTTDPD